MTGVILAAGNGDRLSESLGYEQCKSLVKLDGKNLIDYSLENLFLMNADKIFIVVGKYKDEIKKAVGSDYKGIPIEYIIQFPPIGIINALSKAIEFIDDDIIIQLSDEVFIDSRAKALYDEWKNDSADFYCGITDEVSTDKIKQNFAVNVDENMRLLSCFEKPKMHINNYKGTGFCMFSKKCVKTLLSEYGTELDSESDLCDYMNLLISKELYGKCVIVGKQEINVNTATELLYAKNIIENKGQQ